MEYILDHLKEHLEKKAFHKFYLWDEHTRFIDAERVAGMISASHNTQAKRATWFHDGNFLFGSEVNNVWQRLWTYVKP